ncbi:uncharacterized protein [Littorina saxatilis]|uniref:Uncharacterized protein n=2 Tax=Littorina saxatilis TaxID=31220 RepID=A0AAN9G4R0_9CAEN
MPRTCAVATCVNSETKLRKWGADICEKHHIAQKNCDCSWPFELRPFPSAEREPVIREEWIKRVYGKDSASSHERLEPNKEGRVCSQHFLPGDTVPTLNLGHSRKQVKKKSHPRRRYNSYATVQCRVKEEKNPDVEPPSTPRPNSDVGNGCPSQAKTTTTLFPSYLRPNRCSLPSMTENTARVGKEGQCRVAEERQLIIGNEFAECWSSVGKNEGLQSDTSIAKFLLDMYKNRCSSSTPMAKDNIDSAAMCGKCCTNLILYCPTCQQPSQKQPVQHSSQTSLSQKQTLQDSSVRNPPFQSTSSRESTVHALSLQNSSLQGLAVQSRPWQKVFVQKTAKKTDVDKSSQKVVLPVQVADFLSKGGQFLAQPPTSSVAVPVALHKAGSLHTPVQLAGTASPSGLKFSQISDDVKEEAVNCDTEAFGVLSEEGEDRMDRTEGREVDVRIKQEPGIDDVEPLVVRPSCKPASDRTLHDTVGPEDDLTGLPIHFAETAGIGGNVNSNTGTKEGVQKNYECKLCGSVYRSCSGLHGHKRAKHSGKVYTCDRCDMQTQYKSRLRMHASKCKGRSSVATLVSETSVGEESLPSDKTVDGVASPANTATGMSALTAETAADSSGSMKNDGGKKTGRKAYMCNFCGAVYGNYSSWNCHRKAKHSGKVYTCNICGLQSPYKTKINRHARKCEGLTYRNRNLIADRQMPKALKMSSITCEAPSVEVTTEQVTAKALPGEMGPGSKEAVSHSQAVASSEPIGVPTSVVDFKTATEPSQTNPPSAPANTLLGLAEAVTLTLRQQEKSEVVSTSRKVEESAPAHTTFFEAGSTIGPAEDSGSDLTCDICGKVCPSLFKLRFHKREKHDPEPLWKHHCQECDMSFKEKRSFEAHMNNHRGLKPFSCSLCGSCFASSVYLRHHLNRCRNGKPREYVTHHCDSCDKSFKEKRQFDAHMNSHLGVKPFLCSQCGMSYAHASYLRRHQRRCRAGQPRTYVKYHCDECDQSFKEKRQFEGHMNNHRGLNPFLCSQCGMCFASSMDLKNHRQTCGKTLSGTDKKKKKKKETVEITGGEENLKEVISQSDNC